MPVDIKEKKAERGAWEGWREEERKEESKSLLREVRMVPERMNGSSLSNKIQ